MKFKTRSSSLIALLMAIAGCTSTQTEGPPDVRYGQAECAHCGMIVSQEKFASAICTTIDGEDRKMIYDDLRCMVMSDRMEKFPPDARRYVHDAETGLWLKAEEARFIRDADTHTPMGSGLLAFAPSSPRAENGVTYDKIETIMKKQPMQGD